MRCLSASVVAVGLLSIAATPAIAVTGTTGSDVFNDCIPRSFSSPRSAECVVYISAIADLMELVPPSSGPLFCPAPGIGIVDFRIAVVTYFAAHREELAEPAALAVARALRATFPCAPANQ